MRPLLVVLAFALASGRAEARPRNDFVDEERVSARRCPATSSWRAFAGCQLEKLKFELVTDLPAAKLIAFDPGYSRPTKRLALYLLGDKGWVATALSVDLGETSEMLSSSPLQDGAHRIDIGHAVPIWVTLDETSQRPALLRRRITHVCNVNIGCPQVQTSCELLVHGKVIASYRGTPRWDGRTLKVRGDLRNTNRHCTLPAHLLDDEP